MPGDKPVVLGVDVGSRTTTRRECVTPRGRDRRRQVEHLSVARALDNHPGRLWLQNLHMVDRVHAVFLEAVCSIQNVDGGLLVVRIPHENKRDGRGIGFCPAVTLHPHGPFFPAFGIVISDGDLGNVGD
ncbi:hypothetical protein [Halobacterium sp. R2-5]|uniref:hypothetical protein n=1 Tax=Halobacterium sp. R2-5 TaxID=2715751 RepID=UPI00141E9206|nr:hypothetical protein [Halobacterium sp. R2-5]NIB99405.1 hypothetical protein [Halobacterium sp. R2-5]